MSAVRVPCPAPPGVLAAPAARRCASRSAPVRHVAVAGLGSGAALTPRSMAQKGPLGRRRVRGYVAVTVRGAEVAAPSKHALTWDCFLPGQSAHRRGHSLEEARGGGAGCGHCAERLRMVRGRGRWLPHAPPTPLTVCLAHPAPQEVDAQLARGGARHPGRLLPALARGRGAFLAAQRPNRHHLHALPCSARKGWLAFEQP